MIIHVNSSLLPGTQVLNKSQHFALTTHLLGLGAAKCPYSNVKGAPVCACMDTAIGKGEEVPKSPAVA